MDVAKELLVYFVTSCVIVLIVTAVDRIYF